MKREKHSKATMEEIKSKYPPQKSSLIPLLQECQNRFGYLPKMVMEDIANFLNMPSSKVYGVATFYAQFRLEPLGEHTIKVCHGTACHVKGADRVNDSIESVLNIKSGETTDDGLFTFERVACLGCCSLAPVMMVDDTVYGDLDREKVKKVINRFRGDSE